MSRVFKGLAWLKVFVSPALTVVFTFSGIFAGQGMKTAVLNDERLLGQSLGVIKTRNA